MHKVNDLESNNQVRIRLLHKITLSNNCKHTSNCMLIRLSHVCLFPSHHMATIFITDLFNSIAKAQQRAKL